MTLDRREFQRLRLVRPILATMRGSNALILDIGFRGAFIEHYGTTRSGESFKLRFRWQSEDVALHCEVVRSTVVQQPGGDGKSVVSHTGVRFLETSGASIDRLTNLIATFVGKILAAQRANAAGLIADGSSQTVLEKIGAARRSRSRGYVSYRLKGGKWWRIPTDSPIQPEDGFTVATHEDEEEIHTLCSTYAIADEEGRRLIRLVAELSLQTRE